MLITEVGTSASTTYILLVIASRAAQTRLSFPLNFAFALSSRRCLWFVLTTIFYVLENPRSWVTTVAL